MANEVKKKKGGNKIVAKDVPLSCRPFIIGYGELMGYTGCESITSLNKKFLKRSDGLRLVPASVIGQTVYFDKKMVDKFILKVSEYQEVQVRGSRPLAQVI